jgi:type III secretion system chaperone SycN
VSWVDDAVAAFGRDLGVAQLRLPEQGALELAFERRGRLAIERAGDDLLLYLQRHRPHLAAERLVKTLGLCHWRYDRSPPVRAGFKDDRLVLMLRLPAREVTADAVAQAFERLVALMDQIEA